jgi:hypothetical protein
MNRTQVREENKIRAKKEEKKMKMGKKKDKSTCS